jgi:hypothetical protein
VSLIPIKEYCKDSGEKYRTVISQCIRGKKTAYRDMKGGLFVEVIPIEPPCGQPEPSIQRSSTVIASLKTIRVVNWSLVFNAIATYFDSPKDLSSKDKEMIPQILEYVRYRENKLTSPNGEGTAPES